ncbi:MAG: carboxypeptidase regulatory-like domain-containing protein [Planctomycetes bacterium]|nr:carboxypeptidase regulatory-like domain-containing protein [Planctomycetota bacterium]
MKARIFACAIITVLLLLFILRYESPKVGKQPQNTETIKNSASTEHLIEFSQQPLALKNADQPKLNKDNKAPKIKTIRLNGKVIDSSTQNVIPNSLIHWMVDTNNNIIDILSKHEDFLPQFFTDAATLNDNLWAIDLWAIQLEKQVFNNSEQGNSTLKQLNESVNLIKGKVKSGVTITDSNGQFSDEIQLNNPSNETKLIVRLIGKLPKRSLAEIDLDDMKYLIESGTYCTDEKIINLSNITDDIIDVVLECRSEATLGVKIGTEDKKIPYSHVTAKILGTNKSIALIDKNRNPYMSYVPPSEYLENSVPADVELDVICKATGYLEWHTAVRLSPGEKRILDIHLEKGAHNFRGRIIDEKGNTLNGLVTVTVQQEGFETVDNSDESGTFSVKIIDKPIKSITARSIATLYEETVINDIDQNTFLTITLKKRRLGGNVNFSVTCTDENGIPLKGVSVRIYGEKPFVDNQYYLDIFTDNRGIAEFEGLSSEPLQTVYCSLTHDQEIIGGTVTLHNVSVLTPLTIIFKKPN